MDEKTKLIIVIAAIFLISSLLAYLVIRHDMKACEDFCERHRMLYKYEFWGEKTRCLCGFLYSNGTVEWIDLYTNKTK